MKKRIISIFVVCLLLVIGLSSCGKSGGKTEPKETKVEEAISVFYLDLYDDMLAYNGKYIETVVPINNSYSENSIRAEDYVEYCINIKFKNKLSESDKNSAYVLVRGYGDSKSDGNVWDNYNITRATAVEFYSSMPEEFRKSLDQYKERKVEEELNKRDEYLEKSEIPDYENLVKYPDSNNGKILKMQVKVTEVKPDGLLGYGEIWAVYKGKTVIIDDKRIIREPRIDKGENITIYAESDGLSSIKTYVKGSGILGSNLGAEVVDQEYVPNVNMIYTEYDFDDSFADRVRANIKMN